MSGDAQQVDFDNLIPEMRDWNNGNGIDIDSWVGCMANHKILIGCARILWQDFMEYDGCIFRKRSFSEEGYRAFMQQCGGTRQALKQP